MKTVKFKLILAISIVLFSLIKANAQDISQSQADSIYVFYSDEKISDYQIAIPALHDAINFYLLSENDCRVSKLTRQLSQSLEAIGKIDSAVGILLNAEVYAKECGYKELTEYYTVLSGIYLSLQDFDRVINLIDETIHTWPEEAPDSVISELPTNKAIALVYKGDTDAAKHIFKQIYKDLESQGKRHRQIYCLNNLAALYGMLNELDSAAYFLELAVPLCAEIDCETRLELWQNLATLASERSQYDLSVKYLDSAITEAKRTGNLYAESLLYREIAMATSNTNQDDKAFSYLISHANLQDSLFNKRMIEAVANYQEKYESEKKARLIDELEIEKLDGELRENELKQARNIMIIVGIAVLLLAFGLWRRLKYISKTKSIIEAEKNRADELLLNILPREVAQELKDKGQSEARDYDNVTVLFTDFEDFTVTAAALSAKDLVEEINTCFRAFDDIIQRYKIEKIKTIGDAYMAAGGLHVPRTSEPIDVVTAAIEMQQFMIDHKQERLEKNQPYFNMRVGIHTGPVVAGIVGVKKFQYDIWGDTVNTASRMETNGEVGKVNISNDTFMRIKDDPRFRFESRGQVDVKGKGKMDMWFVNLHGSS